MIYLFYYKKSKSFSNIKEHICAAALLISSATDLATVAIVAVIPLFIVHVHYLSNVVATIEATGMV